MWGHVKVEFPIDIKSKHAMLDRDTWVLSQHCFTLHGSLRKAILEKERPWLERFSSHWRGTVNVSCSHAASSHIEWRCSNTVIYTSLFVGLRDTVLGTMILRSSCKHIDTTLNCSQTCHETWSDEPCSSQRTELTRCITHSYSTMPITLCIAPYCFSLGLSSFLKRALCILC